MKKLITILLLYAWSASATTTNIDPLTSTAPGKIGMAINANTGNWQFVTNVTGTAPTVTDLGANFPVNTTDYLRLVLYSAPNGTEVRYRVDNLSTGNTTNGTVTTNLPASTTFLTSTGWITNNATAAAAIMDIAKIYVETNQ
jgi:hypothetical protein